MNGYHVVLCEKINEAIRDWRTHLKSLNESRNCGIDYFDRNILFVPLNGSAERLRGIKIYSWEVHGRFADTVELCRIQHRKTMMDNRKNDNLVEAKENHDL